MQRYRLFIFLGLLAAVICGLSGARALASSGLAMTASNVTMPSSGHGVSNFTISGFPGDGTVIIGCVYAGTNYEIKIPYCLSGASSAAVPVVRIPVTAGQTLTGTINFYPFGAVDPFPVKFHKAPGANHLPAAGLALAGALMLGFGLRRKAQRWFAMALFAVGALAAASGISGCGGNSMTPGTYPYTITAAYQDTSNALLDSILNVNVEVTVP
jgi:hypothetical protein